MIALALTLLLSQVTPSLSSRVQHDATGEGFLVGWGYAQVPAASADAGVALTNMVDALQAGDKVGSWWGMYGDGTMAAGSAVTLTPTGSPTNTTESGQAVRTYTSSQNDHEPANAAFPASDFTACIHQRTVALPNVQSMAFGTSGAGTQFVSLMEQQTNGNVIAYTSNGATGSPFTGTGATTAGVWHMLCLTYVRNGGVNNNVGTMYRNGVQVGTSSVVNLAQALSSQWSTNGYANASVGQAKAVRSAFVTYKALSAADLARIYAAMAP